VSAGEFDDRFPTEAELVTAYGVSRSTVREAIRRLRGDGLLEARRGSGTFVVRRELDAPILGISGLAQAITAAGLSEASEVLRFEDGPAGEIAARALGIASGATVQWIERLRYAAGKPLALERSALAIDAPQRRALAFADLTKGSIYGPLEALCGVRITGGRELFRARSGSPAERKLLSAGRGDGLFEVERVTYAADRAVEWRRSLVLGQGYEFSATWGVLPPAPSG
jgi:GntR family transcriptional regulator